MSEGMLQLFIFPLFSKNGIPITYYNYLSHKVIDLLKRIKKTKQTDTYNNIKKTKQIDTYNHWGYKT